MVNARLHPRTIEAVKERADIVDIVGEHVVLKKKGREFVGICPFHDDSKPSMTVSPTKQFYYCFSCGAGGNSIKFLMEFQHQNFSDVVLELARRYHLPIETVDGSQQKRLSQYLSRRSALQRVLALASGWFRSQLQSPAGKEAVEYLVDKRGFSPAISEVFELGYAPDQWDGLLKHMHQVERMPSELLEAAGLVVPLKHSNRFYDRFRHRVIIPIHDRQGRVVGFGGRSLDNSEPKYLNSPATEIFEKGKHLFGLDKASNAIRKNGCAVVVEGYFDVIALHAAGITNAVAALGTALSNWQITQLCRVNENKRVVLNFDADGAGIRAVNRAIDEVAQLALQGQLELRVLNLPMGKDPDEFLKDHNADDYRALLNQAPLWLDWQVEQVLADRDLESADQFQQAVSSLAALFGKLPRSAVRTHYLQRVAERLSGGRGRLALQLEEDLRQQVRGQRWHGRLKHHEQTDKLSQQERSEADLLRLYLHCPHNRVMIRQELHERELEDFAIQHYNHIWAAITEIEETNLGAGRLKAINCREDAGEGLDVLDLPQLLTDQLLLENNALISYLTPLLKLDELQQVALSDPLKYLRGTAALLERQKSLKRCRHLLETWGSQQLQTLESCIAMIIDQSNQTTDQQDNVNMEELIQSLFNDLNRDALHYQELYYAERRCLLHFDRQRCGSYAALAKNAAEMILPTVRVDGSRYLQTQDSESG
ncbi:DNA primase [Synechococcus sp. M16CYN]|uniref:DNA primase n=1 Tax=Synechococcus sp. M16CYN TaxID=3103139 RepID=UPI0032471C7D